MYLREIGFGAHGSQLRHFRPISINQSNTPVCYKRLERTALCQCTLRFATGCLAGQLQELRCTQWLPRHRSVPCPPPPLPILLFMALEYLYIVKQHLLLCGDVELNPGPNHSLEEKWRWLLTVRKSTWEYLTTINEISDVEIEKISDKTPKIKKKIWMLAWWL